MATKAAERNGGCIRSTIALRVLPFVQNPPSGVGKGFPPDFLAEIVLPVFRATSIAWVAAKYPAHARKASVAAEVAADAAVLAITTASAPKKAATAAAARKAAAAAVCRASAAAVAAANAPNAAPAFAAMAELLRRAYAPSRNELGIASKEIRAGVYHKVGEAALVAGAGAVVYYGPAIVSFVARNADALRAYVEANWHNPTLIEIINAIVRNCPGF